MGRGGEGGAPHQQRSMVAEGHSASLVLLRRRRERGEWRGGERGEGRERGGREGQERDVSEN